MIVRAALIRTLASADLPSPTQSRFYAESGERLGLKGCSSIDDSLCHLGFEKRI
jgi:hypothetical protein